MRVYRDSQFAVEEVVKRRTVQRSAAADRELLYHIVCRAGCSPFSRTARFCTVEESCEQPIFATNDARQPIEVCDTSTL